MKAIVRIFACGMLGLVLLGIIMGSGVVPGAYNTIQNNMVSLTKRSILNFPNSGCADDAGNASTDCTFLTASTVPGNYTQSFTSQTSVVLTHNLNTTAVIVQCYSAATPPLMILPNSTAITDANDVTVTFSGSQSGKCQVSGSNASGGGGGGKLTITWTAVTYQNGWSDFGSGYQPVQYGTDGNGNVWVRGLAAAGTVTFGTVIFAVPSGLRPMNINQLYAFCSMTATPIPCPIDVQPGGDLLFQVNAGLVAPTNPVSLNLFWTIN